MLQSGCSEPRQTLGGSGGQDCDPVVLRSLDKKPGGYSGFPSQHSQQADPGRSLPTGFRGGLKTQGRK